MEQEFLEIVKLVFKNWTALQLAIEHGIGAVEGRQKEKCMAESTVEFFLKNENLYPDEVEDMISYMFDYEFNAMADDDSLTQISSLLCECYKLCEQGKFNQALAKLPQNVQVSNVQNSIAAVSNPGEDELLPLPENEMNKLNLSQSNPASSSSASQPMEDEDGWTTVTRKQK